MNKEDFFLLCVNIMAISNYLFSKRSEALISEMQCEMEDSGEFDAESEAALFTEAIENLGDLGFGGENPQKILDEGYESISELQDNFETAFSKADTHKLLLLIDATPVPGINLLQRITGLQLESYIAELNNEALDSAFNELHQYVETLFYDPSEDFILQSLADEDISVLIENEEQINHSAITYNNIESAVLFNAIDIVEWFTNRYPLNPEETSSLLITASEDGVEYFNTILNIIKPQHDTLDAIINYFNDETLIQALKTYKQE